MRHQRTLGQTALTLGRLLGQDMVRIRQGFQVLGKDSFWDAGFFSIRSGFQVSGQDLIMLPGSWSGLGQHLATTPGFRLGFGEDSWIVVRNLVWICFRIP